MTALAIIGGILALLLLLLLASLRLRVVYRQGEALVTAHYLFFRFTLFPMVKKPDKPPKRPKKAKAGEGEEPPKKKKSPGQRLEELRDLIRVSGRALNRLRRHIVIDRVRGELRVARPDAHQTALAYARTALFLQALLEALELIFTLKKPQITLTPDFTREKGSYDFSLRVRVRPLFILMAGAGMLGALLRASQGKEKKSYSKGGQYESAASHR